MNLNVGITGILMIIASVLINVFSDAIKTYASKETIAKRIFKYVIASLIVVFIWFIYQKFISFRMQIFEHTKLIDEIYFAIFISSFFLFHLNEFISIKILKYLRKSKRCNNFYIKIVRLLSMCFIELLLIFLSIFIFLKSTPVRNYVLDDTVVKMGKETFIMPKNMTFELVFTKGSKSTNISENYSISLPNSELVLKKDQKIKLFKGSILKIKRIDNNTFIFPSSSNSKYIEAGWNENTSVSLDKKMEVSLESDTRVRLGNSDSISFDYGIFNMIALYVILLIYYFINLFVNIFKTNPKRLLQELTAKK